MKPNVTLRIKRAIIREALLTGAYSRVMNRKLNLHLHASIIRAVLSKIATLRYEKPHIRP